MTMIEYGMLTSRSIENDSNPSRGVKRGRTSTPQRMPSYGKSPFQKMIDPPSKVRLKPTPLRITAMWPTNAHIASAVASPTYAVARAHRFHRDRGIRGGRMIGAWYQPFMGLPASFLSARTSWRTRDYHECRMSVECLICRYDLSAHVDSGAAVVRCPECGTCTPVMKLFPVTGVGRARAMLLIGLGAGAASLLLVTAPLLQWMMWALHAAFGDVFDHPHRRAISLWLMLALIPALWMAWSILVGRWCARRIRGPETKIDDARAGMRLVCFLLALVGAAFMLAMTVTLHGNS
jgi:hypothetical protein